MAKNYSLTEAVRIIVENEDAAALVELGKRFPLLVSKITRIAAKAGEELNELMQFMPENLTANKVNQSIRKALEEDGEGADEDFEEGTDADDAEEEVPAKSVKEKGKAISMKKNKKSAELISDGEDTDYENWNNAKMYKLLGEMGKRKDCKEKYGDMSHDSMLKYLKKYGPGSAITEDEESEDEAEEKTPAYENMKAVELYKLCKERKINAEKQKTVKYYVTLLKEADEAAAQAEDDAESDEDWDDEDEEEEAPAPKKDKAKGGKSTAKSVSKGKGGKPAKKDEEEDEDWDIQKLTTSVSI